jgi:hypothetical protein
MPHTSWSKATESDIRNCRYELTRQLRFTKLPADAVLCSDLQCHEAVCSQANGNYARVITNARLAAADVAIPKTCRREASGRIPCWSEHVQSLKEKSIFWRRLWLYCDRPRNCVVTESRRGPELPIIMPFGKSRKIGFYCVGTNHRPYME